MRTLDSSPEKASLIASAIRLCLRKYFTKESISFADLGGPENYNKILKAIPALPGLVRLYQESKSVFDTDGAGDTPPSFYRDILWSGCNQPGVVEEDGTCYLARLGRSHNTLLHFVAESTAAVSTEITSQQRALRERSIVSGAPAEIEESSEALELAKKVRLDQLRLVLWLLRQGADPFFNNKEGLAPVAYMMENSEFFEQFYRKWLVGHPAVSEPIKVILSKLKTHWQNYNAILTARERDFPASPKRFAQRREDLNKLFLFMEKVEGNLFIVWDLILEVFALEKAAPRGRSNLSILYDITMPLIKELNDILKKETSSSKSTYSKKVFVFEVSRSLLIKSREKRLFPVIRGVTKSEMESPQAKAERRLPATENILTESLHRLMISEAMRDESMRDTKNVAFYHETIWGRLWARMQAMISWLHKYDRVLTAREMRSPGLKRLVGENEARLAARRSEWRAYKNALNGIFGVEDVLSFVRENSSVDVLNAIFPRNNPVCESQSSTDADSIAREGVMTRYLQFFNVLVPLIERGRGAARGVSGISDLHDNMYAQWNYIRSAYDSWMEEHLTENRKLILVFQETFSEIRNHFSHASQSLSERRGQSLLSVSPLRPLSLLTPRVPCSEAKAADLRRPIPASAGESCSSVRTVDFRRPIPMRRNPPHSLSEKASVPEGGPIASSSPSTSLPSGGLFKKPMPRQAPVFAKHLSDGASDVAASALGVSRRL